MHMYGLYKEAFRCGEIHKWALLISGEIGINPTFHFTPDRCSLDEIGGGGTILVV